MIMKHHFSLYVRAGTNIISIMLYCTFLLIDPEAKGRWIKTLQYIEITEFKFIWLN